MEEQIEQVASYSQLIGITLSFDMNTFILIPMHTYICVYVYMCRKKNNEGAKWDMDKLKLNNCNKIALTTSNYA